MSGAAKVNINVTNLTQSVVPPTNGVVFLQGRSIRGPFAKPDEVINSWNRFVQLYGGLSTTTDAPLIAKRILDKGGSIRFSRVGHYNDITDAESLDAEKATIPDIMGITLDGPLLPGNNLALLIGSNNYQKVYNGSSDQTLIELVQELNAFDEIENAFVVGEEDIRSIVYIPTTGSTIGPLDITGGAEQPDYSDYQNKALMSLGGEPIFALQAKNPGLDGNNIKVIIDEASNGDINYFNLRVENVIDPTLNELYQNLTIVGAPTENEANYLLEVTNKSKLVDVVYYDVSHMVEPIRPINIELRFTDGSDGSEPIDTDYIGDSNSRTGFHAFSEYDDSYYLATADNSEDAVIVAGVEYTTNRKDLIYITEIPNDYKSVSDIIGFKEGLLLDSQYAYIFGGGLKLTNPFTGQPKEAQGLGDVLALAVQSDINYGPWYSFAGPNRGLITGALGVINNYGSSAYHKELDQLANRRINMIINRNNSIKLWGNFTARLKEDQERFLNIVKLVIYLKKSLGPVLETFLEEPNDIPTWRRIYYTVKPFMDSLVTKRAIYSYEWQGDQFVNSMNDLKINDASDVSEGKYRILLPIQAIPSLQEINLGIILTKAGVTFEVIQEQI